MRQAYPAALPRLRPAHESLDKLGHELILRVYYEDTDAGGVVYYANYLRYLERARTEWLRVQGFNQSALLTERLAFAVRSINIEYLRPARLDDELRVSSGVKGFGHAQITFCQNIWRADEILLEAQVRIACIDPLLGKPQRMPSTLYARLLASCL